MKKVQILLSTYNGEKFVEEQIESLLNQDYKNIDILIRDDGSKDQTKSIIKRYEMDYPEKIVVMDDDNIGVKKSFMKLIEKASEAADYVAFCDQDDYWEPQKISRLVEVMEAESQEVPLMYFSKLNIVDSQLNYLRQSPDPEMGIGFENALIQNIATGCTMGINQSLLKIVKSSMPDPDLIVMHDAWLYLVASAFGKNLYDKESYISYRQHESNAVGMSTSKLKSVQKRYEYFKKERKTKPYTAQANEFYKCFYNQLDSDKQKLVYAFLFSRKNMMQRMAFVKKTNLYRQTEMDTKIYKICYIKNWY
ncbi:MULTISPECIES: glycosyltransferase family 2 protein [Carnobacterium]|uniref:glycosyltransferase family 2 protein n=1 Tax=Carnobacterium TaxID=2747 RepID=UPI0028912935|nr:MULTISPECIES: glycosyltransferase family 2 protein [Carnobacterium]MDT1939768.1 glycosyltransferase family 2 protein [Carnobacterium divergens]MDT1942206.1 glycosyltransferase family 2 protein [Carnobacterium divergens]MDT1948012.1 glycosyltransferase family 2 protein [Carnobacterium divergens]MDT1950492.1 glycosyltransferase family 2 protein [Carnobacterium divergens]MDT1956552.1 glycosyltransferase family 2 protein [Carnobacterium divergens]